MCTNAPNSRLTCVYIYRILYKMLTKIRRCVAFLSAHKLSQLLLEHKMWALSQCMLLTSTDNILFSISLSLSIHALMVNTRIVFRNVTRTENVPTDEFLVIVGVVVEKSIECTRNSWQLNQCHWEWTMPIMYDNHVADILQWISSSSVFCCCCCYFMMWKSFDVSSFGSDQTALIIIRGIWFCVP